MSGQAQAIRQPSTSSIRPYTPSWVDHFTNWVDKLPGTYWLYYVGASITLLLIVVAVKWWDGSVLVGNYIHYGAVAIGTTFYYPAFICFLDSQAKHAFKRLRPLFNGSDELRDDLEYRLTTMPARSIWLISLLGVIYGTLIFAGVRWGILHFPAPLLTSLPSALLEYAIMVGCNTLLLIFIYHIVHQLRIVNTIYTQHTEIDLFNLTPLYAFSGLTAQTAIGIILIESMWLTIDYGGGVETSALIVMIILLTLSSITFLFPLLGIHRLLEEIKSEHITEASQFLKKCLVSFKRCVESETNDEIDTYLKMIDGAERQIVILKRTPTWPWQPETLRGVMTALLLPITVWLITHILERLLTI